MPRGAQLGGYYSKPALGTRPKGRAHNVYVNCMFDPETFATIRNYAVKHKISASEAIRQFVEWGMEALDGDAI